LKFIVIVIILSCFIPITIYILKPRASGRRLFGIITLSAFLSLIAYVLFISSYQQIVPPIQLFFLFLFLAVALFLGRSRV